MRFASEGTFTFEIDFAAVDKSNFHANRTWGVRLVRSYREAGGIADEPVETFYAETKELADSHNAVDLSLVRHIAGSLANHKVIAGDLYHLRPFYDERIGVGSRDFLATPTWSIRVSRSKLNIKELPRGESGEQGTPGDTLRPYFAWAKTENGVGFSLTPSNGTPFFGVTLSSSLSAPTNPLAYLWMPLHRLISDGTSGITESQANDLIDQAVAAWSKQGNAE